MAQFLVAALYKFVPLADYRALREPLFEFCRAHEVRGTLLLAEEGVNGTIAGPEAGVRAVLQYLRSDPRLGRLEHKESWAQNQPFYRLKVKLKREIVTMGVPNVQAETMAGTYVAPDEWNELIADPDVVVIDVRNDYEVAIGSFQGAVNPHTRSFTEFPEWVAQQAQSGGLLDRQKKPKVAMFCTGGIRCEKSTAYLRSQGYDEVYHLQGGILKYLENVPAVQSRWDGECFVFDERVSVGHGLRPGHYELCRACRLPLSEADKASPLYEEGISCPHCQGTHTEDQMRRFRDRQKQVELARRRKTRHIGATMPARPALEPETDA
ncbi:rhodanese-related sulfurtransferase [Pusillimonas sp.]|uniref:oxygen-dependent tRNA uridine(34) hydroxylase TrhO n=1 Tax=Pusillimonas sp. TaxID=3040095 RepID=UPI0029BCAAD4|nr:rhodanese-related sulfurtransferase [Pusillimonas sp.]MDX3893835.1 rhodanese-related sulfurtransferase [Pusillimonas sp.]